MLNTIKNAWRIPELRSKMLFTLLIIIVYRFGSVIPVPFIDASSLSTLLSSASENTALGYINMLTGGAFTYASLFAMGISPYINSSIIMQLLTVAIPYLENLSKEGEEGRKKIATLTRYVTVVLGLIQGVAYYIYLRNSGFVKYTAGFAGFFVGCVIVLCFTAGTALIMWMGEQINDKGIGNGISIILFAGIVARLPVTFGYVWQYFRLGLESPSTNGHFLVLAPLFVVLFLGIIWVIVFMNEAERRVPVQYAKRVVGRKMYGGQSTYMPIKVTMSGVLPVIFASSILFIPQFIHFFVNPKEGTFWASFFAAFEQTGVIYVVLYFLLILVFAYFYMAIQYNPLEMANNLRQNNGTVPGIRPGKPTADFIGKILNKVTLIGALFLAFVALVPMIYSRVTGMTALSLGGTSVIIIVGVALETVRQMESQMMMRHYKGFLD